MLHRMFPGHASQHRMLRMMKSLQIGAGGGVRARSPLSAASLQDPQRGFRGASRRGQTEGAPGWQDAWTAGSNKKAPAEFRGPNKSNSGRINNSKKLKELDKPSSRPQLVSKDVGDTAQSHQDPRWKQLMALVDLCDRLSTDYWLRGWAAAVAQGVKHTDDVTRGDLYLSVQWDSMQRLHQEACSVLSTQGCHVSRIQRVPWGAIFTCHVPASPDSLKPPSAGVNKHSPKNQGGSISNKSLHGDKDGVHGDIITVCCEHNTVVGSEPHRTSIPWHQIIKHVDASTSAQTNAQRHVWVESLWSIRRHALIHVRGQQPVFGTPSAHASPSASVHLSALLAQSVTKRLSELQNQAASGNSSAWADNDTYAAWVGRFGTPKEASEWVQNDAPARLGSWVMKAFQEAGYLAASRRADLTVAATPQAQPAGRRKVMQSADASDSIQPGADERPLAGMRLVNLLGSHGLKAIAAAKLGAQQVTVVDVSPGNARYAEEVATLAGVELRYIISDVLRLHEAVSPESDNTLWNKQDWVLMENGILHYFLDLQPLFKVALELLAPGGCLLLRDFHPISTKLVTVDSSKKLKVEGNYFNASLVPSKAAFTKYQGEKPPQEEDVPGVLLRKWTLGEVVTAVAQSGFTIERVDEEPGPRAVDRSVPKSFTIIARRPV